MKDFTIKVEVQGRIARGKSTVMQIIEEALVEAFGEDHVSVVDSLDGCLANPEWRANLKNRIDSLKNHESGDVPNGIQIVIAEKQLARSARIRFEEVSE